MNRLQLVFKRRHVVLPVIHVESIDQAQENVGIAREAGSDGVFLINHGGCDDLHEVERAVRQSQPGFWIGLNCLGSRADEVFHEISPLIDGVWTDNAGIDECSDAQPFAERVDCCRSSAEWTGLYFGGVAFKYQREVCDLAAACRIACRHMDVVTTSGPGTGASPNPEKIRTMKAALENAPLAIASGITPDNVSEFLPIADCFLVATGISRSFTELDPDKLRRLLDAVHA